MNTHIITKDQLDAKNYYTGASADFDGHLEIAPDLGIVLFKLSLSAKGSIIAMAGSGIEAGSGIKAGWGIEAGLGIKAGWGIETKFRVFAGMCIWRLPTNAEQTVTCNKFTGTLAFGKLIETSKS